MAVEYIRSISNEAPSSSAVNERRRRWEMGVNFGSPRARRKSFVSVMSYRILQVSFVPEMPCRSLGVFEIAASLSGRV